MKDAAILAISLDDQDPHEIELRNVTTTVSEAPYTVSPRHLLIIFIGIGLAMFLSALDQTIVATALPVIASDFNALDQITWVVTAYMIPSAATQPISGKMADIFGRRAAMLFSVTVFLAGSALCGAATSIVMLIVARFIAGFGAGGIFSLVVLIISDLVPLAERGKYGGIIGGVFAIAYIVGPLLGGVFTEKASWRWAFYFNLPTGAITVAIILLYLRIPTPVGNVLSKLKRVDYVGCVLIVAALTCLMLAFTWAGGTYAWGSGVVVGLLVTGVVLSVGFVVYESKVEDAIVPPRLFRIRNVALCFSISVLINMTYVSSLYYIPLYYQVIRGDSAIVSGMKLLPLLLAIPAFAWLSGYLMERLNVINIWMQVGTVLLTVGMTLLYTLDISSSLAQEIVYMLLVGIGIGNTIQTPIIGGQAATRMRDLAVVTGVMSFSQNAGGMFGITVAGVIFNNVLVKELTSRLAGLPSVTPDILKGVQTSVLILRQQSPEIQQLAQEGYMAAFKLMFLALMPFVALAFILSLFLEKKVLSKSEEAEVVVA